MAKRRGNREGTIAQRADGRWEAKLSLPNGRRHSVYGRTYETARRKKFKVLKALEDGSPIPGERLTARAFLEAWLAGVKVSVRPRTWQRYEESVRLHLVPGLGRVPLSQLSPERIEQFLTAKLAEGLAPRTVGHLRALLIGALNRAMRRGQVVRNVAALTDPIRIPSTEPRALTLAQTAQLLRAAEGDRLHALYVLAVLLGLRQGELLNLRWRDVDLRARTLAVTGTLQRTSEGIRVFDPKTARSRRRLELPELAVGALRRHRARQLEEKMRAGDVWEDADLVFASSVGTPLTTQNVLRRSYWPLLAKIGLATDEISTQERQRRGRKVKVKVHRLRPAKGITFHSLRHTAASLTLQSAVQPAAVSAMLGHARTSTTTDIYQHALPSAAGQAAQAIEGLVKSELRQLSSKLSSTPRR